MTDEHWGFSVLDGSGPSDRETWRAWWDAWQKSEVFAHPSYVELYSDAESRPFCAVAGTPERGILLPFLLREVGRRDSRFSQLVGATDITSPYGYGGPFLAGDVGTAELEAFWRAFSTWARDHNAISEFVRFGPARESAMGYGGDVVQSGFNVVRDLNLDAQALWMDVEHKVRKNVKRARRSGVTVKVDCGCTGLDSFIPIYTETMDRRRADRSYYLSQSFFEKLCGDLAGSYAFFHASLDGIVVSTELVLISDENVYSFLGGTNPDAFSVRPNDLLKYTIIEWAQALGKKRFILGGGYQPDDGILRYKLSFAPNGRTPFHVGRRVLDRRLYEEAVAARRATGHGQTDTEWEPRPGYFPVYRA
ncbi:MAG: GNAT family N-acetyltransferase [Actinomycetia bacterium]|nr:GNAT family N-acetyltransferase [Actinomycetes bacterium]